MAYSNPRTPVMLFAYANDAEASLREFAQLFYRSLAGGPTISEAFQAAETGHQAKHGDVPRGICWSRK